MGLPLSRPVDVPSDRRTAGTLLRLVPLLAALVPPILIGRVIARYGVDVPYWDQWDFVPLLAATTDGHVRLDLLWAQHNEHRIVFPRLVMLALAAITRWDVRAEMWAGFGFAFATLATVAVTIVRTAGPLAPWLIFVASWIAFSPAQWENWTAGWQVQIFMHVFTVAVAAFSLTLREARSGFALLVGAAAVGVLCFASGLVLLVLLPFAVALAPWSFPSGGRRWYVVTAVCAAGVLAATYLSGYQHVGGHPSPLAVLADPIGFVRYVLVYLGGGLSAADATGAAAWGAAGLVVLVAAAGVLWVTSPRDRAAVVPWIVLAAYAVLTGVMTGIGRLGFGVGQALSSRYVTITALFWMSVVVMAGLGVTRLLASGAVGNRARILVMVGLACVAVMSVRSYRASWKIGDHEIRDRARRLRGLRICVRYMAHAPSECLLRGYPRVETLRAAAATLEALGFGPFKDPPDLLAHAQHKGGTAPVLRGAGDGRPGLLAPAPSDIALPVDGTARRLHLEFGIAPRAWEGRGERTDGVEFRVATGTSDDATILWSRHLDPVRLPHDRGAQSIDIELPGEVGAVILQTRPGGNTRSDFSYWAAARTH